MEKLLLPYSVSMMWHSRMIEICSMSWKEVFRRCRGLMEAHCREFKISDLDLYIGSHEVILEAESQGQLDLTVALEDEVPIGYIFWYIGSHPSFPGLTVARLGPWHITPQRRGHLALRMFRQSLDSLRRRNAAVALATLPLRRPQKAGWLRRLGGTPFELTWMIPLEGL